MTSPEKELAKKLVQTILNIPGQKLVTVSMEQDTSSFKVGKNGEIGASKWSKEILLALLERGITQEGSVLIREELEEGSALYGILLGRGGLRALTVNQLGQVFLKTNNEVEKGLIFKQLKF